MDDTKKSEVRGQESEDFPPLRRPRRYKRFNLYEDAATGVLSGRLKLVLPAESMIIALQPNSNLYPTGISLVVFNEDFPIVPSNCEPPLDLGLKLEEVTMSRVVLEDQLNKLLQLLTQLVRSRPDDQQLRELMEARARVCCLVNGRVYGRTDGEVRS